MEGGLRLSLDSKAIPPVCCPSSSLSFLPTPVRRCPQISDRCPPGLSGNKGSGQANLINVAAANDAEGERCHKDPCLPRSHLSSHIPALNGVAGAWRGGAPARVGAVICFWGPSGSPELALF